jgi:hypothetical protein
MRYLIGIIQVWKARCAVTGKRFFGPTTMTITRWKADEPPTLDNLVVITRDDVRSLRQHGISAFDAAVVEKIEARLAWARLACNRYWEDEGGTNQLQLYESALTRSRTQSENDKLRRSHMAMIVGSGALATLGLWMTRFSKN